MTNTNLLIDLKEILNSNVITDSCNCIYNRKAVSFVYQHDKEIDKDLATRMIKMLLESMGQCGFMIYKALTLCKVAVFLIDRFLNHTKFVKTVLNKLLEIHRELTTRMKSRYNSDTHAKLILNSEKVLYNINMDCKRRIPLLFSDKEVLDLTDSLSQDFS